MRQLITLFRRELAAYFFSPTSYVVWGVFLIISGYLFVTTLRDGQTASLAATFYQMSLLMVFVTPLITMHLVAEEKRLGTMEVLMADPTTEVNIILAKFMASSFFLAFIIAATLAYPLVLYATGQPDLGPIAAGYIGLILLSILFASVGLLTSTLFSHPFAAASVAFTILLLFLGLNLAVNSVGPGALRDILSYLSAFNHYSAFTRGIVDTRSVIYYVSLTSLSLFLAVRFLVLRRSK